MPGCFKCKENHDVLYSTPDRVKVLESMAVCEECFVKLSGKTLAQAEKEARGR